MRKFKVGDRIKISSMKLTGTITIITSDYYVTKWDQTDRYPHECIDTFSFIETKAELIGPKQIKEFGIVKFMKDTTCII